MNLQNSKEGIQPYVLTEVNKSKHFLKHGKNILPL